MTDLSKTEAPPTELAAWLSWVLDEDERAAKGRYMLNPNAPAATVTFGLDPGWVTVSHGDSKYGTSMTDEEYRNTYLVPMPADERVMADITAKRAIIELHYRVIRFQWAGVTAYGCATCRDNSPAQDADTWPCNTVLALASAYEDRPGCLDEWLA